MRLELCFLPKQQALTYVRRIRRLFSPAVNPGDNFDEQKPGNARQSKEKIKVVWHRSFFSVERERDRAMPGPLRKGKENGVDWDRLPKES